MHELSVCQALLAQVEEIARREGALRVERVLVRMGPLCGVVPELLAHAFTIARAGGLAEDARLDWEQLPVRVQCTRCGAESEVEPNRLLCRHCGDFRTRLLSGDELVLASVELSVAPGEG